MSDRPTKLVVDCSLPEGDPNKVQVIPLTDEEIAEREAQAIQAELEQAEREAAEAIKQTKKQSAFEKLKALGLTQDEISAILG